MTYQSHRKSHKHHGRHHHHHHGHDEPSRSPPSAGFIRAIDVRIRYPKHGNEIMTTALLKHTNPTTRLDGSPLALSDIARIEYFDDVHDGNGALSIGAVEGAAESFTTPPLLVGPHSITSYVTDTKGHVSPTSNAATFTVEATLASPSPITDLTATLIPDAAVEPPVAAANPR